MTNSSPQTPPPSPEEEGIRQQLQRRVRQETVDEWIAILVAFGAIGAILFWSLGFRRNNFFSAQSNNSTVNSEDVAKNNKLSNKPIITPLQTEIIREVPSSENEFALDSELYAKKPQSPQTGASSSVISAAPIIGAVKPKPIAPEPKVKAPETKPEPKPVTPEPEPEPVATAPETVVSFDDVTEEHWAYPFLQELGKQQLVAATSDNNFEPDQPITRAGMATLVSQAFKGEPKTKAIKDFKDIDDGNVIAEDIDRAVTSGFMKGYSDDEFRPTENIPRYQVLVTLATGLDLKPSGDPVTILEGFSDRDRIPKWAISQVAAATEAGLTVNRPDFGSQSLNPEEPATRAEVAAMIYQTLLQQQKVPPVDSEYIVPLPE